MNYQISEKDLRTSEYKGFWMDLLPDKKQDGKPKTAKDQKPN